MRLTTTTASELVTQDTEQKGARCSSVNPIERLRELLPDNPDITSGMLMYSYIEGYERLYYKATVESPVVQYTTPLVAPTQEGPWHSDEELPTSINGHKT